MRTLVLVAALAAAALPATLGAAQHCDGQIYLFSRYVEQNTNTEVPAYHSGNIACTVGEEDANSDLIYPGSNTFVARWIGAAAPSSGSLTFDGTTTALNFGPCAPLAGVLPRDCYDSQVIPLDQAASVNGGAAVVTVCVGSGTTQICETRTYRTVA